MTQNAATAVQLWAADKLLNEQGIAIPDPSTLRIITDIDLDHGDYGYGGEIVSDPRAEIQITNDQPRAYLLIELDQSFEIEHFVEECIAAAGHTAQE